MIARVTASQTTTPPLVFQANEAVISCQSVPVFVRSKCGRPDNQVTRVTAGRKKSSQSALRRGRSTCIEQVNMETASQPRALHKLRVATCAKFPSNPALGKFVSHFILFLPHIVRERRSGHKAFQLFPMAHQLLGLRLHWLQLRSFPRWTRETRRAGQWRTQERCMNR